MKINTVALMGAGAIGAYFIWGMQEELGDRFCVVAEGERAKKLKENGLTINGVVYHPPVKTPEEAAGADLLLVATKYSGLEGALPQIKTIVKDNTTVLSLLNGVDSEEIIAGEIGEAPLVYSLMRIAARRVDNSVTFDPEKTTGLFMGEKGVEEKTERIRAIEELLQQTKVKYNFVPKIEDDQWTKFALNIAYNLPQAVLGVGYGAYYDSEHVQFISKKLEEEVRSVAAAYGFTVRPLENVRGGYKGSVRFSTLQDLEAKRHTEIDMFTGVLMEKAKKVGIAVPYAEYTFHLIKALEEKNDGLFDYE